MYAAGVSRSQSQVIRMNPKQLFEIRESTQDDVAQLADVYANAFPDEELMPLVVALLESKEEVVSLVACVDRALVGHILMTMCGIEGRSERVALLAPLGVVSAWQRRGAGAALIAEGLRLSLIHISEPTRPY